MLDPMGRTRHRPGRQQPAVFGGTPQPTMQTAPAPLFGTTHQIRPQRVALDITSHRKQMLVLLNRKGLEASLIEVPRPDGLAKRMPALRVRERQPADEFRKFAIRFGPHH